MSKTIQIKGGLGNQLFQYAYGRKLEIIDKKDVTFDIYFFENINTLKTTHRLFLLPEFNINPKVKFTTKKPKLIYKIFKKITQKITGNYEYYQSEKYFIKIKDVILKEFIPVKPLSTEVQSVVNDIKSKDDSISIHIRRGDYIKNNLYVCDLDYYYKAIEYIKTKTQNPTFFIFSDDIEWVKNNLKIENAIYVSNPETKEYEEMILMSECKHNIIANSTFSWWAAYLNKNPEKIIIAPKQWTNEKTANELDILPESWIQI